MQGPVRLVRAMTVVLAAVGVLGCVGHAPIDTDFVGSGKTAKIVVVHPDKVIYRQIVANGLRRSDHRFNDLLDGLLNGAMYGSWLQAGPAVWAAGAILDTTVTRVSFNLANASISAHETLLARYDVREVARRAVEGGVSEFSHLKIAEVISDSEVEADCRADNSDKIDFDACVTSLGGDFAVLIAYVPQFTPDFEILEISSVVSVYDQSAEPSAKPVYRNEIVFQSPVHAGQHSEDTRQEIEALIQERKQRMYERQTQFNRGELTKHDRVEIQSTIDSMRRTRLRRYIAGFDEHDPDGDYWLDEDGTRILDALREGLNEIVRLVVYDINGGVHSESAKLEVVPGTSLRKRPVPAASTVTRSVFREKNGTLISIDSRSRFIPREAL
ncbi:MAG: hypothetical protein AAFX10_12995 [Pseudomonadota bacterium]